jgi:hypothetical protein
VTNKHKDLLRKLSQQSLHIRMPESRRKQPFLVHPGLKVFCGNLGGFGRTR